MKDKEDPDLARQVGQWLEDVLGREIEDTMDPWKSLKSGVVLVEVGFLFISFSLFLCTICLLLEVMNKIQPGIIPKYNKKDNLHVLMERVSQNEGEL